MTQVERVSVAFRIKAAVISFSWAEGKRAEQPLVGWLSNVLPSAASDAVGESPGHPSRHHRFLPESQVTPPLSCVSPQHALAYAVLGHLVIVPWKATEGSSVR